MTNVEVAIKNLKSKNNWHNAEIEMYDTEISQTAINRVSYLKSEILVNDLAIEALQEKSKREDPKPLTIEHLCERIGKPVYEKISCQWYVIDYILEADELCSCISMTDNTAFDTECDEFEFYDHETKGEGNG